MSVKQISEAFERLEWAFDSHNVNHATKLFEMCLADEKGHRGVLPDFARCHTIDTISARQAAKLFAVKRVAEYLRGDKLPEIKDYLHTQKSCYYAAAMALECRGEILKEWKDQDLNALADLDYCDYVKTVKQAA